MTRATASVGDVFGVAFSPEDFDSSDLLFVLTGEDTVNTAGTIEQLSVSRSINRGIGQGSATLVSPTVPVDDLRHGVRLDILAFDSPLDAGLIGSTRVGDHSIELTTGGFERVELSLQEFGHAVLSDRRVSQTVRDERLSAALERLLTRAAPGLSLSYELDSDPLVSETISFEPALRAIERLVDGRGRVVSEETTIRVVPFPTEVRGELRAQDITPPELRRRGDDLLTRVRVEGGSETTGVPEAAAPQVSSFRDLTDGSRRRTLTTSVGEVSSARIRTRTDSESATLVVRLHPTDADGEPVNPDDPSRDFTSKRLNARFLADDGFSTVLFSDHTISSPNPALIVEQTGTESIAIGGTVTDGDFAPAVRDVTTQRPTVVAVSDAGARQRFGRRDGKLTRENISSFSEARQAARRKLRRSSEPREELRVQAASQFSHSLRPMDAVEVTIPRLNFDRETFLVAQVDRTLQAANLTTDLRLRQPPGFNT